MRRFLSLVVLLFITVPFGASLAGCGNKTVVQFCNGGDSGPVVGQVKTITLSPNFAIFGESLNFGQIGSGLSASAVDCKGTAVSVRSFTYASSNLSFADINPSTGAVCGGTYNRFTGGSIPDYTLCNPPTTLSASITQIIVTGKATADPTNLVTLFAKNSFVAGQQVTFNGLTVGSYLNGLTLPIASVSATADSFTVNFATAATQPIPPSTVPKPLPETGTASTGNPLTPLIAYVTATAEGATSNPIPVYIHPIVTSIVLGNPTPASSGTTPSPADCLADPLGPATNCCPLATGVPVTAPAYTGGSCLSQGVSTQLTARVYASPDGGNTKAQNVTCQIGHLQYAAQTSSVFTVDQNGVATAAQPGSSIVTASVSNSGTGGAAGFFSTCPPASIQLAIPGTTSTSATVAVNTSQPLTALVKDVHGVTLTGINLEFNSTTPSTIPAGAGTVSPNLPGSATITAVCQPASCNTAPFSQIGLFGNGEPLTSNGIQITAPGNNATVLYIASTQSQYLLPVDFSQNAPGTLVKLPYTPNSMVISQDGTSIYLGSSTALMVVSATNNALTSTSQTVPGKVLSVSPSGGTVVVTDPDRKTVSLVTSTGTVTSTYGGVGISAQWSPDSNTIYIAAQGDVLLVHSAFTGWTSIPTSHQYVDVAVTVPSVGAYFATQDPVTEAHSYCPTNTSIATGNPPVYTEAYYPLADTSAAKTDKIAATNDGLHILGASATPATLTDLNVAAVTGPGPVTGSGAAKATLPCPTVVPPGYFPTTVNAPLPLAGVTTTGITGVVPSSNSAVAFVTYTGTSGKLPLYIPAASGPGTLNYVTLSGGATSAPVAGVFSTDNKTFYAGTSGDNQIHIITVTGTTATDSSVIAPKLPDANGNLVAPNLLVQRPKKAIQ